MAMIDDLDLGVAMSVMALVTDLAVKQPNLYQSAYGQVVRRWHSIVITEAYDSDYLYYGVPVPWLQIKFMRFLLNYPNSSDRLICNLLRTVLSSIIELSDINPKNAQESNAQNSVLLQAIALTIHVDMDSDLTGKAVTLLGRYISSKETNARYLGLETMSRLVRRSDLHDALRQHQSMVSQLLKDRDISVRRRALDLLYSMCDQASAKQIVTELLRLLHTSEHAMREEMVLKIAILVEKYATEYEWYITIIIQLLASAGDHVSDEVWQRTIQVITNNEDLQEHAARSVLRYMRLQVCHDSLVKVGAAVLGEYGHLIANEDNCTPIQQFSTLHSRFNLAQPGTRAMLLNTYVKFVNLFPEIKEEIMGVFDRFREALDPELQQRACEYYILAGMPKDDLLQAVCDEMPSVIHMLIL